MNTIETRKAQQLLADYCERFSTCCTARRQQCLTAYFRDGYQRIFWTIDEVMDWIEWRAAR